MAKTLHFVAILLFISLIVMPELAISSDRLHKIAKISDDALIYLEDGQIIELAEIIIAKKYRQQAVSLIKQQLIDDQVNIQYLTDKNNRHNRRLAYLYNSKNNLIQSTLLQQGLAQYYSLHPDNKYHNQLINTENIAIGNKAGMWKYEDVIAASKLEQEPKKYRNNFKIIEGTIVATKQVKNKIYLNFGTDWRTDFTAYIQKENLKYFNNLDHTSLQGKQVQVRGWLELYNGPAIQIYNKGQLTIM